MSENLCGTYLEGFHKEHFCPGRLFLQEGFYLDDTYEGIDHFKHYFSNSDFIFVPLCLKQIGKKQKKKKT